MGMIRKLLCVGVVVALAGCTVPRPEMTAEERLVRGGYVGRWDQIIELPSTNNLVADEPVLYEISIESSEW